MRLHTTWMSDKFCIYQCVMFIPDASCFWKQPPGLEVPLFWYSDLNFVSTDSAQVSLYGLMFSALWLQLAWHCERKSCDTHCCWTDPSKWLVLIWSQSITIHTDLGWCNTCCWGHNYLTFFISDLVTHTHALYILANIRHWMDDNLMFCIHRSSLDSLEQMWAYAIFGCSLLMLFLLL